jgi:hypothetical protein
MTMCVHVNGVVQIFLHFVAKNYIPTKEFYLIIYSRCFYSNVST